MARSIGEAAALGIESGFRMGQEADAATERKRATAVQEMRQTEADQRADKALKTQQDRERRTTNRQGVLDNLDLLDRQQKVVQGRQGEIEGLSTAAQTAGGDVDPQLAAEYGKNAEFLKSTRQKALDFFSRVQTGQTSLEDASPAELYMNLTAATGMSPKQLGDMPKHIDDVTAGMQTNNNGLLVQGVNGLFQPQLQRGIGAPSPHGGMIERKEIIGLDPAVDANHQPLPGKFMPRLRVYVKTDGGGTKYYDAPMTVDGSHEGDDRVAVIDVKNAMQYMGNMGVTANAMQRPDMVAKLIEGQKQAGPEADRYLDELRLKSRPAKPKGAVQDKLDSVRAYAKEQGLTLDQASEKLQKMGVLPSTTGGAGTLAARLAAVDDLEVPDDQKDKLKRDITLGANGRTTGLIPQKPAGGSGGATPLKNSNLVGDDFLKTLPVGEANVIKALDEGRMDIKSLSTKGGHREEMMSKWAQYNPGANARGYGTGQAVETAFAKGVEGRAVRSFNVAMDHLDTLTELSKALNNNDTQAFNKLSNYVATQTGSPAPTNFEGAKRIVADEVVKAIVGSGGALADREEASKQISAASSPAQLAGIISTYQKLMGGQLKGLAQQYYGGGGLKDFGGFLSPRTRQIAGDLGRPAGAAPAGGSKYQEGQTATGPGGKKMVFRGGAWQPL